MIARGVSPEQAVARAETAALNARLAAQADAANPLVALATGKPLAPKEGTSSASAATPESYGKTLGAALSKGISVEEAMARATQAEAFERQAVQAEARSPLSNLSSGKGNVLPTESNPVYDRVLALAISRGESPEAAMNLARVAVQTQPRETPSPARALASGKNVDDLFASRGNSAVFQRVLGNALAKGTPVDQALAVARQAEAASPPQGRSNGLPGGVITPPSDNPAFERIVTSAIARGESPAQAMVTASNATRKMGDTSRNAPGAQATGNTAARLLSSPGNSKVYQMALQRALAKGVPPEQAVATARRAEDATALRSPLPGNLAKLAGSRQNIAITSADGSPLPAWLRYDAQNRTFLANDIPGGALPLRVVVNVAGQNVPLTLSESNLR
jgi:hypothetical protein